MSLTLAWAVADGMMTFSRSLDFEEGFGWQDCRET